MRKVKRMIGTTLDSQHLRYGDCFGQKFVHVGEIRYRIVYSAASALPSEFEEGERDFSIEVMKASRRGGQGRQHDVSVRVVDGVVRADPPELQIEAGDVVLWHGAEEAVPAFAVVGSGPEQAVDSSSMTANCVYSHVFSLPGEVKWHDANGSGVSGRIDVKSPAIRDKSEQAKWFEAIRKGILIHINGRRVDPDDVAIVTGQTVFFAVSKSAGIRIAETSVVGVREQEQPLVKKKVRKRVKRKGQK